MAEPVPGRAQNTSGRAHINGPVPSEKSLARGQLFPLFDQLTSWKNLLLAYRRASRGKRGKANVAAFELALEAELAGLREQLLAGTYVPGPYTSFRIQEPKRRLISAASFRDRVAHHALVNILEPIFEPSFIFDTYANRTGKGTHRALDRAQQNARRFRYVLQLDVRQFFPSIDHAILEAIVARKVVDPGVLGLIHQILASGARVLSEEYEMAYFPGDDLFAVNRARGLPIGNLTSQFFGNVYLSSLDHFVCRELQAPGYLRYVDDLLVFGDDRRLLGSYKERIEERLAGLRLTVHQGAHPRPVNEGFPFLGFVVFPACLRLMRRKVVQFRRSVRAQLGDLAAGRRAATEVAASVAGWASHARFGATAGLTKALLGGLPAEITAQPALRARPPSPWRAGFRARARRLS